MLFLVYYLLFLEFIIILFLRKAEWEENVLFYLHILLKFGLVLWMGIIFPPIFKDVVLLVFIFHFVVMKSNAIWIPNPAHGIYFSLWKLLGSLLYSWSFEISHTHTNDVISPFIYFIGVLMRLFNLDIHAFCDFFLCYFYVLVISLFFPFMFSVLSRTAIIQILNLNCFSNFSNSFYWSYFPSFSLCFIFWLIFSIFTFYPFCGIIV